MRRGTERSGGQREHGVIERMESELRANRRDTPPSFQPFASLRSCLWAPISGRSPSLWKEVSAFPGGRLPEQALLSGDQSQLPTLWRVSEATPSVCRPPGGLQ